MRTISVALALCASLAAPAPSANESAHPAPGIKADMTFLADDALEGRAPGTPGHEIAAKYVAARFEALRLQPAGNAGGWYQTVRLHEQVLDAARSKLTLTGARGEQSWVHATNVIITANAQAGSESIEAPVVFAGFGIDAPELGFDDYRGLDVRGKIVAVLIGAPQGTPSEMGAHLNASKDRAANRRGAIGMILIDTRVVRSLYPWPRRLENDASPRMTWVQQNGQPFSAAPAIQATAALDESVAQVLFAGAKRNLESVLDQADRRDGRPKGFDLPVRARIEWQARARTLSSPNVLGLIPGSDPALRAEVVMMMAHLDHVGHRPPKNGDTIVNGALDNAAGVAVMLEVARALAADRPRRSVLFLANTGEEAGLLGTEHFAHLPTLPLECIVAVVNLDVPIFTYAFTDVIGFGAEHSTLREDIGRAASAVGVSVSPDPRPDEGMFTRSDHYSLVKKGIPALFVAIGKGSGSDAAWQAYLDHHYHQPSDDMTQPFDWLAAARFARINESLVREIANHVQRPRWYQGSFFGETFAPHSPKAKR
jgi:hypothetical protein